MLIFGKKSVFLKSIHCKTTTCPSCKTQGSIVISVFRKHVHVYWIPLFPVGKIGLSQCLHCKNVLETKTMPEPIKREYENLKNETKGPIWQFAGVGIIAFLIFSFIHDERVSKNADLKFILLPKKGDIYKYKIEKRKYTTFKVIDVSKDSVLISQNKYVTNIKGEISNINKVENYSELPYGISKSRLKEMHDSGEIYDVYRRKVKSE